MPLSIALITDVFFTADAAARLHARLLEAKRLGADLALLPEIPLNPWSPATPTPRDEDAEPPGGERHRMAATVASDCAIGLIAGAILRDPLTGRRHNTALAFDAQGSLVARYAKVHLPDEPGFHEPAHYEPGDVPAMVIRAFGLPVGLQICSDMNRPAASHALAASGAVAILHPRATEQATYERWKLVLRATAITTSAYVVSVNRPGPEQGVPIGGPSLVIDPNGELLVETSNPVAVVRLDESVLAVARQRYPGYLRTNGALYAKAWEAAEGQS